MTKRFILITIMIVALIAVSCSATVNQRPPDNSAPFVKATVPGDNANDVPINQRITIFFNEQVDVKSAEAAIELYAGSSLVSGITYEWTPNKDAVVLKIPGAGDLSSNTNYNLTINAGYKDTRDNLATKQHTALFSTGTNTAPSYFTVNKVSPESNSTDLQTASPLVFRIFFNDEVKPSAVTSTNFKLEEVTSQNTIDCYVFQSLNMREVSLITKEDLDANVLYKLTVSTMVSNNRVQSTKLSADFTAFYTPAYYRFSDKNNSSFVLFKNDGAVKSSKFKTVAIGKYIQDETTSNNYSQNTK